MIYVCKEIKVTIISRSRVINFVLLYIEVNNEKERFLCKNRRYIFKILYHMCRYVLVIVHKYSTSI